MAKTQDDFEQDPEPPFPSPPKEVKPPPPMESEKAESNKKKPTAERMAALESQTENLQRRLDQIHGVYSSSAELSASTKAFTKSLQKMNGADVKGAKRFIITRPIQRKKVIDGATTTATESAVHIERYFVGSAAELLRKLETEVRWKGEGKFPYAVTEA